MATAADARGTELGRYLKARRAQVRPEDVGLPAGAGLRRTPGLRREELAALAGVSVDYYIRLERGRETNPSPAVVDALGRALRLRGDAYERLHELAELASGRNSDLPACSDHTVRDSVLRMLESVRPMPAYVVNRFNRVLAANPPARRLLPGLWDWPEERRNLTRYLFLHPVGRTLYEPWKETVASSVAHLRAVAGADPDSPELTALVGELAVKSPEFARLWERYDVCERGGGQKNFRHPQAGPLTLTYEVMRLARTGGQRMVVYQAAPGTPDEAAVLGLDAAGERQSQSLLSSRG
ncbi:MULTISPECIES: helix-turn-helix domain-containing protein [Streptomyces]|jgi:transcriptional regulator with XRE-family HTH domain|uniref:Transcriptional regulator with XRE-family HTH domain n=2 Tax=Streptomyces TaxID=1883 RepID=A0ABT9L9X3_STRGD|nr:MULTISPECIES: helix-turn-helix domain-containing protein [Streptomyces]MDP9679582.1 transcriptional regulator with XRE-family HTH domain [Streptomyces griseoviridis]GGT00094.1 transcriptional regulator [Streptomyces griseoviridis]GGU24269.1 transcriptional regulator [Streptomyces daghestanicus]GHI29852.1 transcriptional regulator [Streptomyces daghestanicus]